MPDPMPGHTDTGAWIPTLPAAIRPVPADRHSVRRGRRIIVGDPGYGWLYDLRADDPVDHDGALHVPTLPEADWYRAERDDTEVFAPLVPAARVWVEHADPDAAADAAGGGHLLTRLVTLQAPPPRTPIPARDVPALTGRRVVVVGLDPDGAQVQHRDLRAVSEPYEAADGAVCVRVTREADWYRAAATGTAVKSNRVAIYLVWVE